jgi:general secretion pathway protein M
MSSPSSSSAHNASATAALSARWQALAPREQNLVLVAGTVVALALLWWVALAPALATLRAAPARHAELDRQLQHMQGLQAEALQLQAAPRNPPTDSMALLRTALSQQLGAASQLQVAGDRVTVVLKNAPAEGLAQWLAQARNNARATPIEARLGRSTGSAGSASHLALVAAGAPSLAVPAAATSAQPPHWDGTVVLTLPAAR